MAAIAIAAAWFSPAVSPPSTRGFGGAGGSWTTIAGGRWALTETSTPLPAWPGAELVSVTGDGCFRYEDGGKVCGLKVVAARAAVVPADEPELSGPDSLSLETPADPAALERSMAGAGAIPGSVYGPESTVPRHLPSGGQVRLLLLWERLDETAEFDQGNPAGGDYWPAGSGGTSPQQMITVELRSALGGSHVERMLVTGSPLF
jgi:hypothetical protein